MSRVVHPDAPVLQRTSVGSVPDCVGDRVVLNLDEASVKIVQRRPKVQLLPVEGGREHLAVPKADAVHTKRVAWPFLDVVVCNASPAGLKEPKAGPVAHPLAVVKDEIVLEDVPFVGVGQGSGCDRPVGNGADAVRRRVSGKAAKRRGFGRMQRGNDPTKRKLDHTQRKTSRVSREALGAAPSERPKERADERCGAMAGQAAGGRWRAIAKIPSPTRPACATHSHSHAVEVEATKPWAFNPIAAEGEVLREAGKPNSRVAGVHHGTVGHGDI